MIKEKEAYNKKQVDPAFFETQEPPFRWSRFVHNRKEGTYFGRTPNSWGKKFEMRKKKSLLKTSTNKMLKHAEMWREKKTRNQHVKKKSTTIRLIFIFVVCVRRCLFMCPFTKEIVVNC